MKRTWTTIDGKVHHKVYDKIGGMDAKEYKRINDKKYNERLKAKRQSASPQMLETALVPATPATSIPRPRVTDKLTEAEVSRIKELHTIGLSLNKIGKLYNISSFHVKIVIDQSPK
jgi:hypothetical protein